MHIATDVTEVS